jgi:hypothetical protein
MAAMLAPAPDHILDGHHNPRYGAYQGFAGRVDWRAMAGPARRLASHKRWQFASAATDRAVLAMAIADLGWAASAFVYLFDRPSRRLVADLSWTGLPGAAGVSETPGRPGPSRFHGRGVDLLVERPSDAPLWTIGVDTPTLRARCMLDGRGAPPTLCAIAHPPNARGNCTHKTVGLAATGEAEVAGERYSLDGGVGVLDHTSGLLARDTAWRWAIAARRGFGFNLVEGFNGAVENAVWIDDRIVPVGAARFEFDAKAPLEPWYARSDDGVIDLVFTPEGKRGENKDFVVAMSRYVQPIGTFRGVVRPSGAAPIEIRDLVGFTEDHVTRW